METNDLKKGRLSRMERSQILSMISKYNPLQISKKLKRELYPIYKYLDETVPDWRESHNDIHKEYFESEKSIIAGAVDNRVIDLVLSKNAPKKEQEIEDTDDLESIHLEIKALQASVNAMADKIDRAVNIAKSKTNKTINAFKIETEKAVMEKMHFFASSKMMDCKMSKTENKEIPLPRHTLNDLLKSEDTKIKSDLKKRGVYFLWQDSVVRYVGKAANLRKRLSSHDIIQKDDLVSYITFSDQTYHIWELYYIWKCYPNNFYNSESSKSIEKTGIQELFKRR